MLTFFMPTPNKQKHINNSKYIYLIVIIGHLAVAFILVSISYLFASKKSNEAILVIASIAAVFSLVPDIDILLPLAISSNSITSPEAVVSNFWAASTQYHRGVTHSLLTTLSGSIFAVGSFYRDSVSKLFFSFSIVISLIGAVFSAQLFVLGIFWLSVVTISIFIRRNTSLSLRDIAVSSSIGLLSHPFGDIFTGEPPAFLYPFNLSFIETRVTFASEPTTHFFILFFIELALSLAAIAIFYKLKYGVAFRPIGIKPASSFILAIPFLFFLPLPTVDSNYWPTVIAVLLSGLLFGVFVTYVYKDKLIFPIASLTSSVSISGGMLLLFVLLS